MFSTDLHLWLQSLPGQAWLLPLMLAVSALGQAGLYVAGVGLAMVRGGSRAGLAVLLAVILMAGCVSLVKFHTDLPRPVDVDDRLHDNGTPASPPVRRGGADSAWALPAPEAVEAFRAQGRPRDPGFLSGHTGVTTAMGVALFAGLGWRRRTAGVVLVAVLPAVMAFSRLYLGRHFLADVLAGWLAGCLVGALALWLVPRAGRVGPTRRRVLAGLAGAALLATVAGGGLPPAVPAALAGILLLVVLREAEGPVAHTVRQARQAWQRTGRLLLLLPGAGLLAFAAGLVLPAPWRVWVGCLAIPPALWVLFHLAYRGETRTGVPLRAGTPA